jgi:hypothetical protein
MSEDGLTLLNVNKKVTVGKPLLFGAAGLLGVYLLSKYLQSSKENRIFNTMEKQTSAINELVKRSLPETSGVPKVSNYPEF